MSFGQQPEMARRLRYHSRLGLLGVERFMKHYFLIAKDVGDLTRTVCSCLELRQFKTVPTLSDFFVNFPRAAGPHLPPPPTSGSTTAGSM